MRECSNLAVYVTGSFGRLEASRGSDLDIFFIVDDTRREPKIGKLKKTLIDSQLIGITQSMRFPEFSNDGQYLQFHSLNSMLEHLGDPTDDFENLFTARLLLLLEGRSLCNERACESVRRKIVESYFRDFEDHPTNFRPLFLINDILRFWKTLCLNYEGRRNDPAVRRKDKAKTSVKNLKLKFSRLMTCFSMVISLSTGKVATPTSVLRLSKMPPVERLRSISSSQRQKSILKDILDDYAWFLTFVSSHDVETQMARKLTREEAFRRGDKFASNMYSLLIDVANHQTLRYLTI